mmetsp:Transcript_32711/g.66108  ORF Transcript_32711/g.66108 Transcript_32711/m.66108 type:complete len:115 (+) Transcript_32711:288-632(+)
MGLALGGGYYEQGAEYELVVADDGASFTLRISQYGEEEFTFAGRIDTSDRRAEFVFDKATFHYDGQPADGYLSVRLGEDGVLRITDTYDPLSWSGTRISFERVVDECMEFQGAS